MKKIGLICLAVVLTLGIAGVGFGWWSETLDIGQNPINTGDADMQIFITSGYTGQHDYATMECENVDDNTVSFSIGNYYPGAWWGIDRIVMKNTGTIPLKLKDVTLDITSDPNNIKGYVLWRQPNYVKIVEGITPLYPVLGRFDYYVPIEEVPGKYLSILEDEVIMPGQKVEFGDEETEEACIWIKFDEDAPNPSENSTITFNLNFTWTQFNATP